MPKQHQDPQVSNEFASVQARYFDLAEEEKFLQQTRNPYFSKTEKALLEDLNLRANEKLLEVGCGEGGNLYLLKETGAHFFGIDLFLRKLQFAKEHLPNARFASASTTQLPFADGSFDVILCRDVLHHLSEREPALREILRVCRRGGRILVIEPNGKNPIMGIQPRLIQAEAAIRRNSPESLETLVTQTVGCPKALLFRQPFPVFRAVLHYRFGFPRMGQWRWVGRIFDFVDFIGGRLLPRTRWAYLVFEIEKP